MKLLKHCKHGIEILSNGALTSCKSLLISTKKANYLINGNSFIPESSIKPFNQNIYKIFTNNSLSNTIYVDNPDVIYKTNEYYNYGHPKNKERLTTVGTTENKNIINSSVNTKIHDLSLTRFDYNLKNDIRSGYLFTLELFKESKGSSIYEDFVQFIVLDCPSIEFIDLMDRAIPYSSIKQLSHLRYVFHLTEEHVFHHPQYQKVIQKFQQDSTNHVVVDSKVPITPINERHELPAIFEHWFNPHGSIFQPLVYFQELYQQQQQLPELIQSNQYFPISTNENKAPNCYLLGYPMRMFPFNTTEIDFEPIDYSRIDCSAKRIVETFYGEHCFPEDLDKVADFKRELEGKYNSDCMNNTFPRVLMLGTGSKTNNKRTQSGILIEDERGNFILLDCSPDVLTQMLLQYGESRTQQIVRRIRCIAITHKHFDHMQGLLPLLVYRNNLSGKLDKLLLIVPRCVIKSDFETKFQHYLLDSNSRLFDHCHVLENSNAKYKKENVDIIQHYKNLYGFTISSAKVMHTCEAYGFIVKFHKCKTKLVYSGDCVPHKKFPDLLKAGSECDILIHESTTGDLVYSLEKCVKQGHSNIFLALQHAKDMRAKQLLLTHFSPHYEMVPPNAILDYYQPDVLQNVGINVIGAMDFMRINVNSMKLIRHFYPHFAYIFHKEFSEAYKVTIR